MKIKTIDVSAKEWFDKINGNSYFSAVIVINYGMSNAKEYKLPFQYGYDNHYMDVANQYLNDNKIIKSEHYKNVNSFEPLWRYCQKNKIILRANKQENCKKRDL